MNYKFFYQKQHFISIRLYSNKHHNTFLHLLRLVWKCSEQFKFWICDTILNNHVQKHPVFVILIISFVLHITAFRIICISCQWYRISTICPLLTDTKTRTSSRSCFQIWVKTVLFCVRDIALTISQGNIIYDRELYQILLSCKFH